MIKVLPNFHHKSPFILACSGGVDSMFAADFLFVAIKISHLHTSITGPATERALYLLFLNMQLSII